MTTLQLRIKAPVEQTFLEDHVRTAVTLCESYQAILFINDHWELAIECGAYGVHLGQEDLITADLDRIQQAGLRLGISTHNDQELAKAHFLRPSYIALGHIFPTQTKSMPSRPQGLEALQAQVKKTPDYPTVAIGGISLDLVPAVLACGVRGIALVSAITQAKNWQGTVRELLFLIEGNRA